VSDSRLVTMSVPLELSQVRPSRPAPSFESARFSGPTTRADVSSATPFLARTRSSLDP